MATPAEARAPAEAALKAGGLGEEEAPSRKSTGISEDLASVPEAVPDVTATLANDEVATTVAEQEIGGSSAPTFQECLKMVAEPWASSEVSVPILAAQESWFDLGDGCSLWYRTWGTRSKTPVLFVHGGPGNDVATYNDRNAYFFDYQRFWVVEIDQRGTGKSKPSVRESYLNMQQYLDISIGQMAGDYERLRTHLGVEKWLVFGGSWGSTLGLHYAQTYPERCLGLIVRGIFLNTAEEFDEVYARRSFEGNERRLGEFDTFFELAAQEAVRRGEPPLDPNDSERFVRLYEAMILAGNRDAAWRWFAFEENLMEEDPSQLLDPLTVPPEDDDAFRESLSVSFFECRLFLRGTFEDPIDLVGAGLERMAATSAFAQGCRVWVVQGSGDEVCPEAYARRLVDALEAAGVPHSSRFIDAGHKSSSDSMGLALKECVDEFAAAEESLAVEALEAGAPGEAFPTAALVSSNGSEEDAANPRAALDAIDVAKSRGN